MKHKNNCIVPCRYTMSLVQAAALTISLSPIQLPPYLAVTLYCLAVFSTPFLLLSYYCAYLSNPKNWLQNGILFVAEDMFAILYIGAMIHGIRFEPNSLLFSRLLSAYLICALFCVLGYLTNCSALK